MPRWFSAAWTSARQSPARAARARAASPDRPDRSRGQLFRGALPGRCRRRMRAIEARGRTPLLVGGTMLYFRAFQSGLARLPAADPAIRERLEARASAEGWPSLHADLARLDPASATASARETASASSARLRSSNAPAGRCRHSSPRTCAARRAPGISPWCSRRQTAMRFSSALASGSTSCWTRAS